MNAITRRLPYQRRESLLFSNGVSGEIVTSPGRNFLELRFGWQDMTATLVINDDRDKELTEPQLLTLADLLRAAPDIFPEEAG